MSLGFVEVNNQFTMEVMNVELNNSAVVVTAESTVVSKTLPSGVVPIVLYAQDYTVVFSGTYDISNLAASAQKYTIADIGIELSIKS